MKYKNFINESPSLVDDISVVNFVVLVRRYIKHLVGYFDSIEGEFKEFDKSNWKKEFDNLYSNEHKHSFFYIGVK